VRYLEPTFNFHFFKLPDVNPTYLCLTAATLSAIPSVTLSRAEGQPIRKTRIQPHSQVDKDNLESDENRCQSDESTEDDTKSRKTIKKKPTVEKSRKVLHKKPVRGKKIENTIATQHKAKKALSQDLDTASGSAHVS
jgi:hypothetical protein